MTLFPIYDPSGVWETEGWVIRRGGVGGGKAVAFNNFLEFPLSTNQPINDVN